jgi:hypothetical protein
LIGRHPQRRLTGFSYQPTKIVLRRPLESALGAAIAMMNEAAAAGRPSVMERLFEGVQDEVRMRCPAGSPADDPPRISVDDEGDIDEAGPGRDVGVSRPKEFRLRPLAEPDVNLSAHPAPIIHPTTDTPSTNGRMRVADVGPAV